MRHQEQPFLSLRQAYAPVRLSRNNTITLWLSGPLQDVAACSSFCQGSCQHDEARAAWPWITRSLSELHHSICVALFAQVVEVLKAMPEQPNDLVEAIDFGALAPEELQVSYLDQQMVG